jgi:hypothetical protein
MYRIVLWLGLLLNTIVCSASEICPKNECIAVVDAGNSSSRLYVYHYQSDATGLPHEVKTLYSKQIEPGLANVDLNQAAIDRYLTSLFSEVPDLNMPVYFYATSGMRTLDFSVQQAYYAKLTEWFKLRPQAHLIVAKTLTSREEALFGWLAVNYELGLLSSPPESWVGVVDAGSGSVQIAFPLAHTEGIDESDAMHLELYGQHITLFTHGFLGLGQDQIRAQYLDRKECFPRHYPLQNGGLGAGDFELCRKRIKPLISDIHQVDQVMDKVIEKQPARDWYIIGGLTRMLQQRPLIFENEQFTNQGLAIEANQQVCQQDWAVLGTLYQKNKYLFATCLNASYLYSLFIDGLRMSETQAIHFISNKRSTNDWTMGVVLFASSHLE